VRLRRSVRIVKGTHPLPIPPEPRVARAKGGFVGGGFATLFPFAIA
jgi:hypothetical protein